MDIQVWSDVVCPWCYLGKRRLEQALAAFPQPVTVTFRAFQLDPTPAPRPWPVLEALAARVGGRDHAEQMVATVTALAAADGLVLNFDRAVVANTFDSHRLIAWAARQGRQAAMLEALQKAHFTDGADLGSPRTLASIAGWIGLDPAAALAYLESPAGADVVHADLAQGRELGITSVPTFVIDGRFAVHGAQESSTMLAALEEIARREAVDADR